MHILKITPVAIAGLSMFTVTLAGCVSSTARSHASASVTEATNRETLSDARLLLHEAGISPEVLATIGATPQSVTSICLAGVMVCQSRSPGYDELRETLETGAGIVQGFRDRAARGALSAEDRSALQIAEHNLSDTRADLADCVSQLHGAINATLDENQRAWLWNIQTQRDLELPAYFKVSIRSEADGVSLRDQFAATRESGGNGLPLAGEDEVAAHALHDLAIDNVTSAWNAVLFH